MVISIMNTIFTWKCRYCVMSHCNYVPLFLQGRLAGHCIRSNIQQHQQPSKDTLQGIFCGDKHLLMLLNYFYSGKLLT